MKIAIILGTRPEIIKMSPIIRQCEKQGIDYYILHKGQHYSYEMDKIFFEQLTLPQAKYNLDVGSYKHGEQTGKMIGEFSFKVPEGTIPNAVKWRALGSEYIKRFLFQPTKPTTSLRNHADVRHSAAEPRGMMPLPMRMSRKRH